MFHHNLRTDVTCINTRQLLYITVLRRVYKLTNNKNQLKEQSSYVYFFFIFSGSTILEYYRRNIRNFNFINFFFQQLESAP